MTEQTATIAKDSPFAAFETNKELEQAGVRVDYGPYFFQVARAGGANTRFRDLLRARLAPHKRALATETMSDELADVITREVFAETVVLGWGRPKKDKDGSPVVKDGKPVDEPGVITWRDGSDRQFSVEAVKELFKLLPDLATDLMNQAQSSALYRAVIAELDAKN